MLQPIKWNTPSAPLLTSLLRSRNTIPANRTVTTITSLLQSPCGPPRTRSGKLLPLSTSKIQGKVCIFWYKLKFTFHCKI